VLHKAWSPFEQLDNKMEPFPSSWKDTPKSRESWAQMQRNESFLRGQMRVQQDMGHALKCRYCYKVVRIAHWSENYNGPDLATVDHVVPHFRGGADHSSNMVVACRPCNNAKGCS
jgi:5-methylcytosine-specific restriction endonuclease McrA